MSNKLGVRLPDQIASGSHGDYDVTSARSLAIANVATAMVADRERHIEEAALVVVGSLAALCGASECPSRAFDAALSLLSAARERAPKR